jgi:hypothetical protein
MGLSGLGVLAFFIFRYFTYKILLILSKLCLGRSLPFWQGQEGTVGLDFTAIPPEGQSEQLKEGGTLWTFHLLPSEIRYLGLPLPHYPLPQWWDFQSQIQEVYETNELSNRLCLFELGQFIGQG